MHFNCDIWVVILSRFTIILIILQSLRLRTHHPIVLVNSKALKHINLWSESFTHWPNGILLFIEEFPLILLNVLNFFLFGFNWFLTLGYPFHFLFLLLLFKNPFIKGIRCFIFTFFFLVIFMKGSLLLFLVGFILFMILLLQPFLILTFLFIARST